MEALHHAKNGRRVLVLDASDKVGGAWRECSVFGIPRVEIAPHILLFNRETFDYFSQSLGVRMAPMVPPPRYLVQAPLGPLAIPYVLSPFVAYISVPFHYLTNPAYRKDFALVREEYFGRLGNAAKQILQWGFAARKPLIEYPAGGTLELLDRILERLQETGAEVRLNSRVEALARLENGTVRVAWAGGSAFARSVTMTRHQRVPRIEVEGREIEIEFRPFKYISVHFLMTTSRSLRASFILAKRDPVINLVSDLTPYTRGVPDGKRLIVIRLHRCEKQDAESAADLFSQLKSRGYIPSDSSMDDFAFNTYEQGRMTPESLTNISTAFGDTLLVFKSTNFSNSIGDEIARWKKSA